MGLETIFKTTLSFLLFFFYCRKLSSTYWIHPLKLLHKKKFVLFSVSKIFIFYILNYLNIYCKISNISKVCINKQVTTVKQFISLSNYIKYILKVWVEKNRFTCFVLHVVSDPHPFIAHWHGHFFQRRREMHDCVHQQPESKGGQKVSCEQGMRKRKYGKKQTNLD